MQENQKEQMEEQQCEVCHHHQLEYLKQRMPTQQEMETAAELFKVFGDPTRLKLLAALLAQEMCVCDLSDLLGISQSAVSHQLRLLRASRLVKNRREEIGFLFSGRRPCSDDFSAGNGARSSSIISWRGELR